MIPRAIVGSGSDLEVDEVCEKHCEDGNDGMESELHSGSENHTTTRGSGIGSRGTSRGVGDRSGISGDDAKRRDREDGVHLGGGGRRRGDELEVGGSGLDLGVRRELELDVHGVDGGGSSTSSNLRRTSSLASLLGSLGLVGGAVTVEMAILAAVAAGTELRCPLEFASACDAGDTRSLLLTAAMRLAAVRTVPVPILSRSLVGSGLDVPSSLMARRPGVGQMFRLWPYPPHLGQDSGRSMMA
jgi:hypothetical protein